jgi:formyltetrahydrofolate deformylase
VAPWLRTWLDDAAADLIPIGPARMTAARRYALVLKCPDTKGVVAAVSGYLAANDASIAESSHFNDTVGDRFFMRTEFRQYGPGMPSLADLEAGFAPIAADFAMDWSFHDLAVKPRVLIAVSKIGHCLYDLLHRWRSGQLAVDIVGVVSNHDDMRSFVEWNGLAYHHLPVDAASKPAQETQILALVEQLSVELVVLARYMQILSPQLCAALAGRCINIHHSFLPSFKGARPYHQAHAREGPIIEQAVERVSHADTPEQLVTIGRDIECAVLACAVRRHVDRRVLLNGLRTVVFS